MVTVVPATEGESGDDDAVITLHGLDGTGLSWGS
jgi:hypothetical protein